MRKSIEARRAAAESDWNRLRAQLASAILGELPARPGLQQPSDVGLALVSIASEFFRGEDDIGRRTHRAELARKQLAEFFPA